MLRGSRSCIGACSRVALFVQYEFVFLAALALGVLCALLTPARVMITENWLFGFLGVRGIIYRSG